MVEWVQRCHLTIKDQAELLSLNRTSLYRKPKEPAALEVQIKHLIDRIHTEKPARGSRGIRDDINNMKLGFRVNRKRIQRYMQEMGIQACFPGPNLSKRNKTHYVYPYLLRNVKPSYPNHVWGIDITYIAMHGRWMYLVAIVDWYSFDDAITERFWRTLKWEDIYLMQYDTPKALRIGIDKYIRYYNENRGHSSLNGKTPSSMYYGNDFASKKSA